MKDATLRLQFFPKGRRGFEIPAQHGPRERLVHLSRVVVCRRPLIGLTHQVASLAVRIFKRDPFDASNKAWFWAGEIGDLVACSDRHS